MSWSSLLVALVASNAHLVSAVPTTRAAEHVVDLERVGTSPASSRSLLYSRAIGTARLSSIENGNGYAVPIKFGDQLFSVAFDTGSSDLWVPSSNFQCVNYQGQDATGQCGLKSRYKGAYTGGQIANENFNISYGDGEYLLGTLGYETVTLANITVPKQEVALADTGYFSGDGSTSGLMGFAYPFITAAFKGTNPAMDNLKTNQAAYDPFFFNAIQEKLVDPVFTLMLGRGSKNAGQLTLGGVPSSAANLKYASTPLKKMNVNPYIQNSAKNFSYYTIIPSAYTLNGDTATADVPVIVDSGTSLTYLPSDLAQAINEAFDPPSLYIPEEGVYENYCDATPPTFSITIGGQQFSMSAEDLLLPRSSGYDSYTGGCAVGVQDGGTEGPFILGDVFLRNVIAVFDVGKDEMRFAMQQ